MTYEITRVTPGNSNNSGSYNPVISADGSTVVFQSDASNLIANETDANGGTTDIFAYDTASGTLSRVTPGDSNNASFIPQISADGSTVVFESRASNLIANEIDANGSTRDIFAYDTTNGTLSRVTPGDGNSNSINPVISADGSTVVFTSNASNLIANETDANGTAQDIFAYDTTNGTLSRVTPGDGNSNSNSFNPVISADGSTVVFESWASNLIANETDANGTTGDIFVYDTTSDTLSRVTPGDANSNSFNPVISADGSTVVFQSFASNLIANETDANGTTLDIFVYDTTSDTLSRVTPGDSNFFGSYNPVISTDGSTVVFFSDASNLIANETDANGNTLDIFAYDTTNGTLSRVTPGDGNSNSINPVISADGSTVVFTSNASNLIANETDANGTAQDIFAYDTTNGTLSRVTPGDGNSNSNSFNPVISADGSTVVFESWASNLIANETDANGNTQDIFLAQLESSNMPPDGTDNTISIDEDTTHSFTAADFGFTDTDGDSLQAVVITTLPAAGTLTLDGTAVTEGQSITLAELSAGAGLVFTPDVDANGTGYASHTFQVVDDGGTANNGQDTDQTPNTITVDVTAVNDDPVSVDDTNLEAREDTPLVIAASELLVNDTDADEGDVLSITSVQDAVNGSVELVDDEITFTPNENFTGTASFTYTIEDGNGGTSTADVNITVAEVNDAPVATDGVADGDEDTEISDSVPAATDADNDALTYAAGPTAPANGTVAVNEDGTYTYTPNAEFNGEDSFGFIANDGTEDSNEAIITVTVNAVNDDPVGADDAYTVDEDTTLTVAGPGLLDNDTDPDGDSLVVSENSEPDAGGQLTVNPDGAFTYTPQPGFFGTDEFNYEVVDGNGGLDVRLVTITVNEVNDPPVANDDSGTTMEDMATDINPLENDTDGDSPFVEDILSVAEFTQPDNGTVVEANGTFTYTPDPDFNGTDTFEYTVSDGNGGTDTAIVSVLVESVNDNPVSQDESVTTNEDQEVTIPVLANDSDVDDETLTPVIVGDPFNGSAAVNPDGTITYTPDTNFTGEDSFAYEARDDEGGSSEMSTVTITVDPVNDDPVAVDDTGLEAQEDTPLVIPASELLVNDTDADEGDVLSITSVQDAVNGSVELVDDEITFTPDPDYTGPASFTYTIEDGNGGTSTAEVTIDVGGVNDAPVASDGTVSGDEDNDITGTLPVATDADGDALTYAAGPTAPANGTVVVNEDGTYTYTPNANFNGEDTFGFAANDGTEDSNEALITVTVNPVNDNPVPVDDDQVTAEDTSLVLPAAVLLANDNDPDGDDLSLAGVQDSVNGSVTLLNGEITFTPSPDFVGEAGFTYSVLDGNGGIGTATVNIDVGGVNDAPVANDGTAAGDEDNDITGTLPVATDADNDTLTYAAGPIEPTNGTVVVNEDGTYTYTPNPDFNGEDSFGFVANDDTEDSNEALVTVTVNPVNDDPGAADDDVQAQEDTPLVLPVADLLANDVDVDTDDVLAVTSVQDAVNGTVELVDEEITFTPDANFTGPASFTYTIEDGNGGTSTATVNVDVSDANDAPVATDGAATGEEDTEITGTLPVATDADEDALTYAAGPTAPANGSVVVNEDGTYTYTPNADFNGEDSFGFVANDGTEDSNEAIVTVTVNPVNDDPVAVDDAVSTDEGTPVTTQDVVANDTDVDGDDLGAIGYTQAANGSVTSNMDGTFNYTPNADFFGTDSFDYTVSDGNGGEDTGTVNITVNEVPDEPGGPIRAFLVSTITDEVIVELTEGLVIDSSLVDGIPVSIYAEADPALGGTRAFVRLDDGPVRFEGQSPYSLFGDRDSIDPVDYLGGTTLTEGAHLFTVDLYGNGLVGELDVNFSVGEGVVEPDPSVLSIGANQAVLPEGTGEPTEFGFTINRTGDTAEATSVDYTVTGSGGSPADTDDFEATTGTVNFAAGQTSALITVSVIGDAAVEPDEAFTVTLSNPAANAVLGTASAGAVITNDDQLDPDNTAPSASDDGYATEEDTPLVVAAAAGVLLNDLDNENDPLSAVLVSGPADGTLDLNPDGGFTYTPDANYYGPDSFTYRASDGALLSDAVTVNIDVTAVNDAPVANDDSASTLENTPVVTGNVLANDFDPDGQSLIPSTNIVDFTQPANGSANLLSTGSFEYTPNPGFTGTDSFEYTLEDSDGAQDTATVTVTVNEPQPEPQTRVYLVNTATDEVIVELTEGLVIDRSLVEGVSVSIFVEADPALGGTRAFVQLDDGPVRFEGQSPYSLFGDRDSVDPVDYLGGTTLTEGDHVFSFDLYGNGLVQALDINFSVGDAIEPGVSDVSIEANTDSAVEGTGLNNNFTFTLSRTGDLSNPTSVDWVVTGAQPEDFAGPTSGTVAFAAGQGSAEFAVQSVGDSDIEPDELITATISTTDANTTISVNSASSTILDDDTPEPVTLSVSPQNQQLEEGNTFNNSFVYTLVRSGGNESEPLDVSYVVAGAGANPTDSDDFGGLDLSGTVTFAAGQTSLELEFPFTSDTEQEADEGFTVDFTAQDLGGATVQASGTILDDDTPDPLVLSVSPQAQELEEGNTVNNSFVYTLERSGGNESQPLDVNYAVTGAGPNPTDSDDFGGLDLSGVVTFAAGQTSLDLEFPFTSGHG